MCNFVFGREIGFIHAGLGAVHYQKFSKMSPATYYIMDTREFICMQCLLTRARDREETSGRYMLQRFCSLQDFVYSSSSLCKSLKSSLLDEYRPKLQLRDVIMSPPQ